MLSPADRAQLKTNLERIHERIEKACLGAGRDPAEVSLVAVTKYAGLSYARALLELGQLDLGENRVDHLLTLASGLSGEPAPRWHMIGHLQRNKARLVADTIDVLHSLDSLKLARKLEARRSVTRPPLDVYVEIRLSAAAGRSGIERGELSSFLDGLTGLTRLRVVGLMGLPPAGDLEDARTLYAGLRQLLEGASGSMDVRGLSMGMTADLEQAIEAGATVVRVGRALLEGLSDEACRT